MKQDDKVPAVFLSYAHSARSWLLEKLLPRVEAAGFRTIVDFRDFRPGKIGLEEMEKAVMDSAYTFVLLDKDYVLSQWCEFENVMVQSLDPAARQRRLIPILRESCDIPLRLRILHYRDLREDSEQQWHQFETDIKALLNHDGISQVTSASGDSREG